MKKALVVAIVMVLGLGALAFAGPLSGSWTSELTIGFRDIVVTNTDTQALLAVVPGLEVDIYNISLIPESPCYRAMVPAYDITLSIGGVPGTYTVPAHEIAIGPYSVNAPSFTFNIPGCCPPAPTGIAFPAQPATVTVCGTSTTTTLPGGNATFAAQAETVYYDPVLYVTDNTVQTPSALPSTPNVGPWTLPMVISGPPWLTKTVTLPAVTRQVTVDNGTVETVTIPAVTVTVPFSATTITAAQIGTRTGTSTDGGATLTFQDPNAPYVITGAGVYATLPARTITLNVAAGTSPAQLMSISVPAVTVGPFTLDVNGNIAPQTVTFPAQSFSVSANTAVIPAIANAPVTIGGTTYTFSIPARTVTINSPSLGHVSVPPLSVTIPAVVVNNGSQTFTKIPTLGFTSTLIVDYTVGGWTFNSTSKFADTGWTAQSFAASGTLGAFSMDSKLIFDPSAAAFTSWDSNGSVSIAGVKFDGEFFLTALGSGWTFGASGSAGDLSIAATVYFNMTSGGSLISDEYCFCFSSVDFDISFPFTCIDLVDISLGFSTAGFDGITFAVTGIEVPGISWITFDASLTFDDGETGKSLTLTPNLNLGDFSCLTLYAELVDEAGQSCTNVAEISGIKFYGIGLDYTWNGVSFSSQSSFDAAYNEEITGLADYWELFKISSEADACCGGAFDFSVSTYFSCESAALFDWGESVVKLSMGLGSNYTGWTSLTVTDAGFTQWKLGFEVTW